MHLDCCAVMQRDRTVHSWLHQLWEFGFLSSSARIVSQAMCWRY